MKTLSLNWFLKYWLPVIIYAALIFYVSSIPRPEIPIKIINIDKVLHILEYLLFGFLIKRALSANRLSLDFKRLSALTMLLCLLYGLSDEYHQFFIPGRQMSVLDAYSDAIGGLLGSFFHSPLLTK
ncbi:MAG: VanZ family protein [Candidatus Omnitrophota bacterium]